MLHLLSGLAGSTATACGALGLALLLAGGLPAASATAQISAAQISAAQINAAQIDTAETEESQPAEGAVPPEVPPPSGAQSPDPQPPDPQADPSAGGEDSDGPPPAEPQARLLPWLSDVQQAMSESSQRGTPILVRFGADYCPWCHKLAEEIEKPQVQQELARWTLLELDIDDASDLARRLAVGPIPALRVLGKRSDLVASHDGYLPAEQLAAWLSEQYQAALARPPKVLTDDGKVDAKDVASLIEQFARQDASLREAAIKRLLPHRDLAAEAVAKTFAEGRLGQQLTALELLAHWNAPLGDMDPWRPETLTPEQLDRLRAWSAQPAAAIPAEALTPQQQAAATAVIDRLVDADRAEAEAIGGRLARYGSALLPIVYDKLKQARNDAARQRLTWLRYRLVATDALVLRWPGGLDRLAAAESKTRHAAAEELARFATPSDSLLLLELFSDPDPLVRELSLKALSETGGERVRESLVRLLDDPEPNVRAAVLKYFSTSPSAEVVPEVVDYVAREKDPDLVVHAVRLLRATKGRQAIDCLMGLLEHASWQVRAESAEAIGECLDSEEIVTESAKAKVYVAMIKLLDDQDGFVVSRAINTLEQADFALAVEPLGRAAEKHPDLATPAVQAMLGGANMRPKAIVMLRNWVGHSNGDLRAAALAGLCSIRDDQIEQRVTAALGDQESKVRRTAAEQLLVLYQGTRPAPLDSGAVSYGQSPDGVGIFSALRSLFGRPSVKSSPVVEEMHPPEADPDAEHPVEEPRADAQTPPALQDDAQPAEDADPQAAAHPQPDAAGADHTEAGELPPGPIEDWLLQFRSGQDRPAWMLQVIAPLEKMLSAESVDERVAAALALVPLGKDDPALEILMAATNQDPRRLGDVAAVLAWLPWDKRLATFERLKQTAASRDQAVQLAAQLVILPDRRAAGPLWQLLAGEQADATMAQGLLSSLQRAYLVPPHSPYEPPQPGQLDFGFFKRQAAEGSHWQRIVALALLHQHDKPATAEAAATVAGDPSASDALRRDAFVFLLLSLPEAEARQAAVKALDGGAASLRETALAFICSGSSALSDLGGGDFRIPVVYTPEMFGVGFGGEASEYKPPEFPSGLDHALLRRLVDDPDAPTAAYAGFLLALAGQPDGLEKLLAHWRESGRPSDITALVYRAIGALDDSSRIALLEEIYESYDGSYDIRDFYWSIRGMHGPEILALRKRIRDEIGMDRLQ